MKEYKIVFAGDSTTDADKLNTCNRLGNGYVNLVNAQLAAFKPQNRYSVINSGISGNTSRMLLARWDEDVTVHNPDVTFCMIGINDVWRQIDLGDVVENLVYPDEYERNLTEICKKSAGKKLIFMTPYFMESNRADDMRKLTEKYIEIMKKVAAKFGFKCLDVQADFDEYMKHRSGQTIGWDRVHPGIIGAQILARAVMTELNAIIK